MKPESISEQMRFNTVKLETNTGIGTGFFYNFEINGKLYPTIITNKHVINNKDIEDVKFHLHLKDGLDESNCSIGIYLKAKWYFHSTYDLCFTFVNPLFEEVKKLTGKDVFYIGNNDSILATKEKLKDLSALEEVVMVGYPIGISDDRNNFPIFRKGYTASHPAIDFNRNGIGLVDMACFPGSSGSPIFILNEGGYVDKSGNLVLGKPRFLFLGILFAGPNYNVIGNVVTQEVPTSTSITYSKTAIMTNLGYYIKAEALYEFRDFIKKQWPSFFLVLNKN